MAHADPAATPETAHHPRLWEHFESLSQQRQTAVLGMWAFLATEVLFFGGLFTGYTAYRFWNPETTRAFAEAAHHLKVGFGAVNTFVLIGSSLTVALAVHGAQTGHRKVLVGFLALTIVLGLTFLGIKTVEYYIEYQEGLIPVLNFNPEHFEGKVDPNRAEMFFVFYFCMTGLHALHMIAGIGVMVILLVLARRDAFSPAYHTPVEVTGLYWHFVDVVWIFLFPVLYLIARHSV